MTRRRIHLDTDIGTDPDDACALAMLLGWPGVELIGITTADDPDGRRAEYLAYCLDLAGRGDIPHARGPDLDLMERSVALGATIVGIGPWTNLALLEQARPGRLRETPVVVMGGWLDPPAEGLPPWGPERDTNTRSDPGAALTVIAAASRLTMVTLPVTLKAQLRAADLPRLRGSGPLGVHLAEQTVAHARETGKDRLGAAYPQITDDFLNFHYDPVTCAVAAGWPGAILQRARLRASVEASVLRLRRDPGGSTVDVVVDLDGAGFTEVWLAAVAAAQG